MTPCAAAYARPFSCMLVGLLSSTVSDAIDCTDPDMLSADAGTEGVAALDSRSFDHAQSRARSDVLTTPQSRSECWSRPRPAQAACAGSPAGSCGCTSIIQRFIALPMPIMTRRSSAISRSASRSERGGGRGSAASMSGMLEKSDGGGENVRKEKLDAWGEVNSGKFLRNSETVERIALSSPADGYHQAAYTSARQNTLTRRLSPIHEPPCQALQRPSRPRRTNPW